MSEWICVSGELGDDPIEIETEEDGTMLLESLTAHFPGTTTLKYKNPENLAFRGIKCIDGILNAPSKDLGWGLAKLYYCVNPEQETSKKRKGDEEVVGKSKHHKDWAPSEGVDPSRCTDLVLLGLSPETTEQDIRDYFAEHGELGMVQVKKSKDENVGYGFIRFKEKEVERDMLRKNHEVDGKKWILRVPDSQQGDKAHRKIYISYHSEEITSDDLRQHFEKYGEITDVYISSPWRHFAFVTFADVRVAHSLIGKEHHIKDVSLLIKSAVQTKSGKKEQDDGKFGENMGQDMPPNMYPGYGYGPPGPGGYGPEGYGPAAYGPGGFGGMMPAYGGPMGGMHMHQRGGWGGGYPRPPVPEGRGDSSHGEKEGPGRWDKKPTDAFSEGYKAAKQAGAWPGYGASPWPGYGAYGPAMGGYKQNKNKIDLSDL